MVSPTTKRDAVAVLQGSYRIPTRRACRLVGHHRSTQNYQSTGTRDATALRARMKELAAARPRYGYRRIFTLLRREGWKDNIKRVQRLYRLDGLALRRKARKKRRAVPRVPPAAASAPGERWAIDFIHDMLADGRTFRVLSVVDVFSRSSEILEAGIGFTGARVAELLDKAARPADGDRVIRRIAITQHAGWRSERSDVFSRGQFRVGASGRESRSSLSS